ncbi:antitoxin Xre/MbcA/ParS toxin-binding domain-containing protein [Tranquillimonas alkanivorans]|uniref:Antitoxin Xre/MbcA/ParS-like toxin-binding domain-containing protein n=1 Tax=Tranquillimonas alkanivorans TaxID=441119 RepID=A0A1I5V791_9RHOB|nr:antitoxin Xre/MbcA/ParS toxin-binding domain-containing protein [Tranquillimonas alkanivorans]SFQ03389.1 Protein of unknown function [Tranquillimonas alkanivorans]
MELNAVSKEGVFAPRLMAQSLRTTVDEIAQTAGLGRDALVRSSRVGKPKTQKRLREMMEIVTRTSPRFGSDLMAYAWYRSTPLPGYGVTPMQLVQDGRADLVHRHLDRLDAGVHA